ncbi:MAG TPA: GAF domain-containing sensor histidine kinase [Anaerolineae bacterium]|nr:GAF domain-containing sensor histidine kinase [Anaerolineae bacterium]HQK14606.1 GAF domain-containing sensor histidine kinase [Anaerolineae bacterium]
MEKIKINSYQAREMLTQLQTQIREQRQALQNGASGQTLEPYLEAWETMVQHIQTEMMLEKSAQLGLFYEVSRPIYASLDWRQTLQAVLDAFITLTSAERGLLLVLDVDNRPQVEIIRTATHTSFSETDITYSRSIVQQTLERKSPILTSNAQIDPRFTESESVIAYGLRSILCVPLIHNDEVLGAIYLDNRARTGVFTAEDMATLSAFAENAAVALYNALTHQKTDQTLAEKIRELTILQEMTRDLNASLLFNRVMERGTAWAIAASGAEAGVLGLVAEDGIRWITKLSNITPDNWLATRCIGTHEPYLEDHCLVLPLLRENRPIGVLYLVTEERTFKKSKLEFITRVADNVAIAVDNARLYEALRQANLTRAEFISTLAHELRTPITCIWGYVEMLGGGMLGTLTPQQQEFVETIGESVQRMETFVNNIVDISQIEAGRMRLTPRETNLRAAIDEVLKTVAKKMARKQQSCTVELWEGLPAAYADPDRLRQILNVLIQNAIKYTPAHGVITIKAWLSADEPDFIRCAVSDTGIGISPENQARMFTKFFRITDPATDETNGSGLGLAIAKNLVEMHDGRIWLESVPGKGSTFYFTVPIAMPGL